MAPKTMHMGVQLLLLLGLLLLLAACTAGPGAGQKTPVLTQPAGQGTLPAATTTPGATPATQSPRTLDLTNQDSPLAATFTGSSSVTPLGEPGPAIGLKLVAGGLSAPMMLTGAPDISGRLFVVDQVGRVRIITRDGVLVEKPFLDLRDRMVTLDPSYDERGLLSIAFHPGFERNGRFFVFYSAPLREGAPAGWSCTNRLSEFRVSASDPDTADPAGERVLLQVDKPAQNHNGGQIRFGPDGYLYVPLGDGGGADDTGTGHTTGIGNAQNMNTFLGKALRIDVDTTSPGKEYGIPKDNPFVYDRTALPEIYAYGFRNPTYASFDYYVSHHYLVASAGQAMFESAFIVLPGGNYGWNIREGTHCFDPADNSRPKPGGCAVTGYRDEPLIGPIIETGHDLGNTIVGGHLYRGTGNPELTGKYIFGTWSDGFGGTGNGALFVATPPEGWDIGRYPASVEDLTAYDNRLWTVSRLSIANQKNGRVNAFVRGFGEDNLHEVYVMVSGKAGPDPGSTTGMVLKMVPASSLPVGKTGY
ncbi:MAG TPA: PQQ-dependent sugar dehydrogenase [Methanomicrobiales archaeon]|nr:PQQ-dependent sugar dehydrogenase [Methanomicrobiales archaeon]